MSARDDGERRGDRRGGGDWRGIAAAAVLAVGVGVVALTAGRGTPARPVASATPSPSVPAPTPPHSLPAPAPQARLEAAAAVLDGRTVLVGGYTVGGSAVPLSDTWVLSGARWAHAQDGPPAIARGGATLVADGIPAHRLLLVGGVPDGGTWAWDGTSWSAAGPSPAPGAVVVAAAATPTGALLVTRDASGARATWRSEAGAWRRVAAATPDVRVMAYDGGAGDILGLAAPADGPGPAPTWRFDGSTWQPLAATVETDFTAMMTTDPRGGRPLLVEERFQDASGDHGGTWGWTGTAWRRLALTPPPAVLGFDVTQPLWAESGGRLAVVGGPDAGDTYRDMWVWDAASGTWSHLAAGSG